jgi:8-oxo-dGTP pyrophosphatase MutT (NUDIX family)
MTVPLRPAATVILMRPRSDGGFEVLLVKRSDKSAFMAGTHVFPGGVIDADDGGAAMRALTGDDDGDPHLSALRVAGIRELFEEAGILLATPLAGSPFPQAQGQGHLEREHRLTLLEGAETFSGLLRQQGLAPATDRLRLFSRWITPEAHSMRFDAYFFAALCPPGQVASADGRETTEALWLTPAEALAANLGGAVKLSPPAIKTCEGLRRFPSAGDVLASLDGRPPHPILPVLIRTAEEMFVLFPCDPDYDAFRRDREERPVGHGKPSGPSDSSTRVLFGKDGSTVPYRKPTPP